MLPRLIDFRQLGPITGYPFQMTDVDLGSDASGSVFGQDDGLGQAWTYRSAPGRGWRR